MASTWRFYISAKVGTGARLDQFRSKVIKIIQDNQGFGPGDRAQDMMNAATPFRFTVALVSPAIHALCVADAQVKAISPELADVDAVNTWLAGLVGTLPAALVTTMESAGIPLDWVTGTTTRLVLLQFIAVWHLMVQRASGADNTDVVAFLGRNLDNTSAQVPLAARNAIAAFMDTNSIDRTWITGTTTVRAVVTFIVQHLPHEPYGFGPVTL